MNWILRDRNTRLFVAHDILSGYHFTRHKKRAVLFESIASAKSTVLLICNGERKISRKACLEIIRESELRGVDRRRYFANLNRTKG
jgi:hypothetical protein